MSIKVEIAGFIDVYGEDMDKAEKDLLQELIDNFAGDAGKQSRVMDLLHSLVMQGYMDGLDDRGDGTVVGDDGFPLY